MQPLPPEVNDMKPNTPGTREQKRDTKDPHELPSAPRGMMHSPVVNDVHELETGAPKGRAPGGTIIDEGKLSKPVPPPKKPAEHSSR
jgi:hypothetical protein